jgi:uncharacterized protein (TIGR02172 family)
MAEEVQRIDLDDYIQTGEGGTALTYNHKDGKTLAKLFLASIAAENAIREFRTSQVVYDLGVPTPKPIRLITDGTRFGAEYELINNKRSYTRIISQEPDQLVPLSERFAVLAKQIHQTPADTTRLPDMKELASGWIAKIPNLSDNLRARITRFIDTVPSTPTCLHGDLHIGNIITDGRRNLWIDVGDFAYGTPEWDLGMMYYAANYLSAERADSIFHLDTDTLKAHWAAFAKAYYGTDSQEVLDAEIRKLQPFIFVKMAYFVSKLCDGKRPLSEFIIQRLDKALSGESE